MNNEFIPSELYVKASKDLQEEVDAELAQEAESEEKTTASIQDLIKNSGCNDSGCKCR